MGHTIPRSSDPPFRELGRFAHYPHQDSPKTTYALRTYLAPTPNFFPPTANYAPYTSSMRIHSPPPWGVTPSPKPLDPLARLLYDPGSSVWKRSSGNQLPGASYRVLTSMQGPASSMSRSLHITPKSNLQFTSPPGVLYGGSTSGLFPLAALYAAAPAVPSGWGVGRRGRNTLGVTHGQRPPCHHVGLPRLG